MYKTSTGLFLSIINLFLFSFTSYCQSVSKPVKNKDSKILYQEIYTATDEHSPAWLKVTTTYTFNEADSIRAYFASKSIAAIQKDYLEYYAEDYKNIKVTEPLVVKNDVKNNVFVTVENYKIENFLMPDSAHKGEYKADFCAYFIAKQLPKIPAGFNKPIKVMYPLNIDQTIIVDMPNGWDMENDQDSIFRDGYQFTYKETNKNDRLTLHYQFRYLADNIPLNKLNEFRKDIKDLKSDKLYFTFYSIPNVEKVPFAINKIIVIIACVIIGLCLFFSIRIYKTPTVDHPTIAGKHAFAPPIGGWLFVMVLTLVATTVEFTHYLVIEDYFSTRQWNFFLTGVDSIKNRSLIIFEASCYIGLVCYSLFCLFLILKKRDIAPAATKIFYASCVVFLFIDCFFKAYMSNQTISNYTVEQIIHAVIVAVIWTYYINTSSRVEDTFVVPYHDEVL